jgi:hypothetical protein
MEVLPEAFFMSQEYRHLQVPMALALIFYPAGLPHKRMQTQRAVGRLVQQTAIGTETRIPIAAQIAFGIWDRSAP